MTHSVHPPERNILSKQRWQCKNKALEKRDTQSTQFPLTVTQEDYDAWTGRDHLVPKDSDVEAETSLLLCRYCRFGVPDGRSTTRRSGRGPANRLESWRGVGGHYAGAINVDGGVRGENKTFGGKSPRLAREGARVGRCAWHPAGDRCGGYSRYSKGIKRPSREGIRSALWTSPGRTIAERVPHALRAGGERVDGRGVGCANGASSAEPGVRKGAPAEAAAACR